MELLPSGAALPGCTFSPLSVQCLNLLVPEGVSDKETLLVSRFSQRGLLWSYMG
jgi:hypothetical protein